MHSIVGEVNVCSVNRSVYRTAQRKSRIFASLHFNARFLFSFDFLWPAVVFLYSITRKLKWNPVFSLVFAQTTTLFPRKNIRFEKNLSKIFISKWVLPSFTKLRTLIDLPRREKSGEWQRAWKNANYLFLCCFTVCV